MLTFIKEKQKGKKTMSGKLIKINDTQVTVEGFEATDRDQNVMFSITRTADTGSSTGAILSLFSSQSSHSAPSTISVVDVDSNVVFIVSDPKIYEYKYFTRKDDKALEYFKINGSKIGAKAAKTDS